MRFLFGRNGGEINQFILCQERLLADESLTRNVQVALRQLIAQRQNVYPILSSFFIGAEGGFKLWGDGSRSRRTVAQSNRCRSNIVDGRVHDVCRGSNVRLQTVKTKTKRFICLAGSSHHATNDGYFGFINKDNFLIVVFKIIDHALGRVFPVELKLMIEFINANFMLANRHLNGEASVFVGHHGLIFCIEHQVPIHIDIGSLEWDGRISS